MIRALAAFSSSSAAIFRFSSSSIAEPSHMCDWNNGARPASTLSADSAISGRT